MMKSFVLFVTEWQSKTCWITETYLMDPKCAAPLLKYLNGDTFREIYQSEEGDSCFLVEFFQTMKYTLNEHTLLKTSQWNYMVGTENRQTLTDTSFNVVSTVKLNIFRKK